MPGSNSYSIATIGCNFRCGFCQNWEISQASKQTDFDISAYKLEPQDVVAQAKKNNCKSISYTYTEPTIFFEYAYDTARLAKKEGLFNNFVTNGFMTKEAVEAIRPYLDAANIDLKFFTDASYKDVCKAALGPVLDSIRLMHRLGIWVEITTLVIPGLNDSGAELSGIAEFIASIDKNIPWHLSAFHPDYKYTNYPPTPVETLKNAYRMAKDKGLKFIYLGNVAEESDTYCPGCGLSLVKRAYFSITENKIANSKCPACNISIPGVWD
jgi:pyruvate formate lyase activating enzyme